MSPVDRAGTVPETNFALGSCENFEPDFRDQKRPKITSTKWRNKANMAKKKQKLKTFAPIVANCITTVKWDAYEVKNTAGTAKRCHQGRQNSSRFHPGDRASEMFIRRNFQPVKTEIPV